MFLSTAAIPRENGQTSSNTTSSAYSPISIAACIVAPYATASSGFNFLFNSFPSKNSFNIDCIFGILVEPPTKTISLILLLFSPDFSKTSKIGSLHELNISLHKSSNFALVIFKYKSFPLAIDSTSISVSSI